MKISSFSRSAGVAIATAVLAGCGGSHNMVPQTDVSLPSMTPQQQTIQLAEPLTSGKVFDASYSGRVTTKDKRKSCPTTTIEGDGDASFLHQSSEYTTISWVRVLSGCFPAPGATFTLTSVSHPEDSILLKVPGMFISGGTFNYKVAGGTGRFAKARGHGTLVFTVYQGYMTYSDKWTGTIRF